MAVRGGLEPRRPERLVEVRVVLAVQHVRHRPRGLDARVRRVVGLALLVLHRLAVALAVRLEQVRAGAARDGGGTVGGLDVVHEAHVRVEHHLGTGIPDLAGREVRLGGVGGQDARGPGTRYQFLVVLAIEYSRLVIVGDPGAMMTRELER